MRKIIDIKVPNCWQQLKDNQLRYVYKLLNGNFSLPQIQTLCLFKWAKMKVKRREGSFFIVKYEKQVFPVSALQITEAIQAMKWLGDFPVYPVRLSRIGLHRPLPAGFQGVPFGTFLSLDNLYQGYLQTRKHDIAIDMARIMYQSKFQSSESKGKLAWLCQVVKKFCGAKHIHHLSKIEEINVFYWFTSVKRYFANMFTHFFSTSEDELGEKSMSFSQLQDNMNTQIRALTGGDITKEKEVLDMDCWRALTELNAKAKDYEELEKIH
jgi:hypothetical protein